MARRATHMVLGILFLFTATGFTVSRHFCGETLVSVEVNAPAQPCCDTGDNGCCSVASDHFRLQGDFLTAPYLFSPEMGQQLKKITTTKCTSTGNDYSREEKTGWIK